MSQVALFGTMIALIVVKCLILYVKEPEVAYTQRTVRDEVSCTGIGLHCGETVNLTIKPAPADSGIRFIRKDLPDKSFILATNHITFLDSPILMIVFPVRMWAYQGMLILSPI